MSDRLSQLIERVKSLVVDDKNLPTLQSLIYTNKDDIDSTFFDKLFDDAKFYPTDSMLHYIEQVKHQLGNENDEDDDEAVTAEVSDDLVNKIAELDAAYEELDAQYEALKVENETLKKHNEALKTHNEAVKTHNEALEIHNKELEHQNEYFRSILNADGKYVYRNDINK